MMYRYHTMTYTIHNQDMLGNRYPQTGQEEGPQVDGILVKTEVVEGRFARQARTPQDYQQPYWRTFLNAYAVQGNRHLYLIMHYGVATDPKLIAVVQQCFQAHQIELTDRMPFP